jgi:hypothetical protein
MSEYLRRNEDHVSDADREQGITWVLVGLAGFIVGCLIINLTITRVHWQPDLGTYTHNLRALSQHTNKIDTIFIGSSHVQYGIDQILFDKTTSQQGSSSSSFKLTARGMTAAWQKYTLTEVLKMDFPNLRHVIVEPRIYPIVDLGHDAKWKNASSVRSRFISGWNNSYMAGKLLWSSALSVRKKLLDSIHLGHNLALNLSNLGVFQSTLIHFPEKTNAAQEQWDSRGGTPVAIGGIRPDMSLSVPDAGEGYRKLSSSETDFLNGIVVSVLDSNATPSFVFVPGRDDPGLRSAIQQEILSSHPEIRIIGDADFTQGSGTYSSDDLWWDKDHLNQKGSRIFSVDLANQWVSSPDDKL